MTWLSSLYSKIKNDSILSGILYSLVVVLILAIWKEYVGMTLRQIVDSIAKVLKMQIALYYLVLLFLVFIISNVFIWMRMKNALRSNSTLNDSNKPEPIPIWNEKIGNYTFGELYNIMITKMVPDNVEAQEFCARNSEVIGLESPEPKNLLSLYWTYKQYLNAGIGYGSPRFDNNFGYYIVAPKLANYDLAYKKNMSIDGKMQVGFANTNEGMKFYPLLEKYYNENPEFKGDVN